MTGGGTWGTWHSLLVRLPVPVTGFIVLLCGSAEPRPPGKGPVLQALRLRMPPPTPRHRKAQEGWEFLPRRPFLWHWES